MSFNNTNSFFPLNNSMTNRINQFFGENNFPTNNSTFNTNHQPIPLSVNYKFNQICTSQNNSEEVPRYGSFNTSKDFKKFDDEDQSLHDLDSKIISCKLNMLCGVPGKFQNFEIDELRYIDYLLKKRGRTYNSFNASNSLNENHFNSTNTFSFGSINSANINNPFQPLLRPQAMRNLNNCTTSIGLCNKNNLFVPCNCEKCLCQQKNHAGNSFNFPHQTSKFNLNTNKPPEDLQYNMNNNAFIIGQNNQSCFSHLTNPFPFNQNSLNSSNPHRSGNLSTYGKINPCAAKNNLVSSNNNSNEGLNYSVNNLQLNNFKQPNINTLGGNNTRFGNFLSSNNNAHSTNSIVNSSFKSNPFPTCVPQHADIQRNTFISSNHFNSNPNMLNNTNLGILMGVSYTIVMLNLR